MQATLLITALSLGAPALKDPPNGDLKIVGEWIVESQITNGRQLKSTIERRYTFTQNGKYSIGSPGRAAVPTVRTYKIDTSKKPAAIDMHPSLGGAAVVCVGIVKIEGDTLTLCYTRTGDRPTKFESPETASQVLIVLKRAKSKE